jgi:hypothetical protein
MAKKADRERKLEDPEGDFSGTHKDVNYIYSGPDSYESKRKQKLITREVLAVSPTTPMYLKWSKVPITFDHGDHLDFIPKLGRYTLIVSPIIKDAKLNRVLVDGGSSLNIMLLKTFNLMGMSRSALRSTQLHSTE